MLFDDRVPGPPPPPGTTTQVFIEAADYDDGFAKIVHGIQPVSQNLLAEDPDGFAPMTDIGIRLGWDDEQILIWQNRQLKADPTVPKVAGKPQRLDAPMGVFGYRIDARNIRDAEAGTRWSGCGARRPLVLGDVPGRAGGVPWRVSCRSRSTRCNSMATRRPASSGCRRTSRSGMASRSSCRTRTRPRSYKTEPGIGATSSKRSGPACTTP